MTTVFLIRHGLTEHTGTRLYGRTPGLHLSDRGREQADRLAERFAGVRLAAIYSSPLERCLETAAPLAAASGLEVAVRDDLVEMDAGSWTNRTLTAVSKTKREALFTSRRSVGSPSAAARMVSAAVGSARSALTMEALPTSRARACASSAERL